MTPEQRSTDTFDALHQGLAGKVAPLFQPPPSTPDDMSGQRVGPYKLLQRIGEGGFGDVYMAEQEQPVRRRVALKIIKLGMDARQVVARFEAERQALGMMDHPNIARVLDAGATDMQSPVGAGRPYFVMELVKGVPITQYCDENHLTIAERLELFTQVCQAVEHAHQKQVIHRDIKPSNVLVSTVDGRPLAKVIDFGIAKATDHRLTEKTLFTEFHQMIGTPQYMSPEQAAGSLDIDTRADVYSLGVLLYELLTGTPPFEPQSLHSAAYAEIQRIIREVEPPKPSTRLSALTPSPSLGGGRREGASSLAAIAKSRKTDPHTLTRAIRGELDWIVMKCLEKDRARRYETTKDLAQDIQHHLTGQPVVAAPPSRAYRLRKFIRRHRVAVAAGTTVIVALLAGLAGTTRGIYWALAERDKARIAETQQGRERVRADDSAARAQLVVELLRLLISTFELPQPGEFQATHDIVALIHETDATLKARFTNHPESEATVRYCLAVVCANRGLLMEAVAQALAACELRTRVLGTGHAETKRAQRLAAGSLNNLSVERREAGDYEVAENLARQAIALSKQVYGPVDSRTQWSRSNLAAVLVKLKRFEEAETLALAIQQEGWTGHPEFLPKLFIDLYEAWDRPEKAAQWRTRGAETQGWRLARDAAYLCEQADDAAGAETHWHEAIEALRRAQDTDTPELGIALNGLAITLRKQGKIQESEKTFRECLQVRQHALPGGHWLIGYTQSQLGALLGQLERFAEAEPLVINGYRCMAADPNNHFPYRTEEALQRIVRLYEEWHAAEPDAGHDAQAAEWRAKLDAGQAAAPPTP